MTSRPPRGAICAATYDTTAPEVGNCVLLLEIDVCLRSLASLASVTLLSAILAVVTLESVILPVVTELVASFASVT